MVGLARLFLPGDMVASGLAARPVMGPQLLFLEWPRPPQAPSSFRPVALVQLRLDLSAPGRHLAIESARVVRLAGAASPDRLWPGAPLTPGLGSCRREVLTLERFRVIYTRATVFAPLLGSQVIARGPNLQPRGRMVKGQEFLPTTPSALSWTSIEWFHATVWFVILALFCCSMSISRWTWNLGVGILLAYLSTGGDPARVLMTSLGNVGIATNLAVLMGRCSILAFRWLSGHHLKAPRAQSYLMILGLILRALGAFEFAENSINKASLESDVRRSAARWLQPLRALPWPFSRHSTKALPLHRSVWIWVNASSLWWLFAHPGLRSDRFHLP